MTFIDRMVESWGSGPRLRATVTSPAIRGCRRDGGCPLLHVGGALVIGHPELVDKPVAQSEIDARLPLLKTQLAADDWKFVV
jgi:hypothetical protein